MSIDYLLTDRENIHDIEKSDIISYVPSAIGLAAIILYYLLQKIDIPVIFCFLIYFLMTGFSYRFYHQYTTRKNGEVLVKLNTITGFFVTQSIISQILITLITVSQLGLTFAFITNVSLSEEVYFSSNYPTQLMLSFICSCILAGIYAYYHYQKYIREITSA